MKSSPSRKSWWKTTLKASAFVVASLLTLAILGAAVLSYTGRRDWEQVKRELTARGEPLSLAEMRPPPIPDAQNFFADPMWMELADLVDGEIEAGGRKVPIKQIRLPRGERQLDLFNRALTTEETKALGKNFPEFAGAQESSISTLAGDAYEIGKEADLPVRRRAAQFILAAMAHGEPVLVRLEELARRPGAQFPLDYGELVSMSELVSYFTGFAQLHRIRMWAELALGNGRAAHQDAMTALRLQDVLANEPLLLSLLIRLASASITLDAIEEALRSRLWTEKELAELEQRLAGPNFPQAVANALRGERGYQNLFFEQIHSKDASEFKGNPAYEMWTGGLPRLWLGIFGAGDEACRNNTYQNWIDVLDAAPSRGLNARTFDVFNRDVKSLKENWWNRFRYPTASLAIPNMNGIASVAAQLQDKAAQARTVCALERYRLRHGAYPAELSALVPEFLSAVPTDISTLQPLRYRGEGDRFVLWSPGWNEKDEGGRGDDRVWGEES